MIPDDRNVDKLKGFFPAEIVCEYKYAPAVCRLSGRPSVLEGGLWYNK